MSTLPTARAVIGCHDGHTVVHLGSDISQADEGTEPSPVGQHTPVDGLTVEPGGRSALWILPLEYLFGSEDPRLVSAFLDAGGVPDTGQTRPPTKGQQIRSGESSRSLLRLRLEQFPS